MKKIVAIGKVEDVSKWAEGFPTHGELFKSQSVTNCHYTTGENEVVVCFEAEDLDTFMRVLDSPDTAKAMAVDGIKREDVKFFVLDQQLTL